MAIFDDFDLENNSDDLDGIDDGFNIGSPSSSTDSDSSSALEDFSDFGDTSAAQTANEVSGGKQQVIKTAVIIIGAGVLIFALGFGIVRMVKGTAARSNPENQPSTTQQQPSPQAPVQNTANNSNGWIAFGKEDAIAFNEETLASTFTVTDIKHYAKVVDGENNLMVKTVLTGSLSGFIGTYELEIPYEKGCLLSVGNYFNVDVNVGEFNGKRVVGEIKY